MFIDTQELIMYSRAVIKEFFKAYLLKPLCYVVIILAALWVLNQFTYFNLSLSSNNNFNSFEVIGVGKVSTTPKEVGTTFTVSEKGTTQKEAQDAANKIQNQAISTLTELGISKANIKTTGFNVSPNYEEGEAQTLIYPPRQVQNGYVATISTTVKKSTVDQINKAIDQLTALGVNVGGVDYQNSDQTQLQNEAQAKAIKNAQEQAQNLAKAAGFKLGKIVTIRNADDLYGAPQPYSADAYLKAAPSTSTDLQPGTSEVTARMGVTYYIKN